MQYNVQEIINILLKRLAHEPIAERRIDNKQTQLNANQGVELIELHDISR